MKHFMRNVFITLMVLNIVDLSLTYTAFHFDGVYEANPINAIFISLGPLGYVLGFFKDLIVFYFILNYLPKKLIKDDERFRDNTVLVMSVVIFVIKIIVIISDIYWLGLIFSQ